MNLKIQGEWIEPYKTIAKYFASHRLEYDMP